MYFEDVRRKNATCFIHVPRKVRFSAPPFVSRYAFVTLDVPNGVVLHLPDAKGLRLDGEVRRHWRKAMDTSTGRRILTEE